MRDQSIKKKDMVLVKHSILFILTLVNPYLCGLDYLLEKTKSKRREKEQS